MKRAIMPWHSPARSILLDCRGKRKAPAREKKVNGFPPYNEPDERQPEKVYPFELLSARRKDGGKCVLSIGSWNKKPQAVYAAKAY